jgi:hypothetical protein
MLGAKAPTLRRRSAARAEALRADRDDFVFAGAAYDETVHERAELVTRLVRGGRPLPGSDLNQLQNFGWDSNEILVVLTTTDAKAILERHFNGNLSLDDLVTWANQIEGRDDVGFEAGHEKTLGSFIFELANPTLQTEPPSATAGRWFETLTSLDHQRHKLRPSLACSGGSPRKDQLGQPALKALECFTPAPFM